MNRRDLFKLAGKVGLVALAAQVPWDWLERAGLIDAWLAEAATLPQNYTLSPGTVLFSGNAGIAGLTTNSKGFGLGTSAGTDNTNSAYIYTAGNTKSIKVAIDATAGQTAHNLEWTIGKNFQAETGTFGVWIGVPVEMASLPDLSVYISSSPFSKYFLYSGTGPRYRSQKDVRWNYVSWHRDAMSNTGLESWGNTMTRVRLQIIMPAGQSGDVYVDTGYYGVYGRPKVLFTFDDGYASALTEGYAYMSTRGLRGAVGVNSALVGGASRLTVADCDTLYAGGWDMLSHSANHDNQTSLSQADRLADIRANQAYLTAHGWTRGASQYIYPNGAYDAAVVADLRTCGYTEAWAVTDKTQHSVRGLWPERMGLARYATDIANSLSTLKGYGAAAIAHGGTVAYYSHNIKVSAVAGETEQATFRGLIDYFTPLVAAGVMDNPTCSEWVRGLTNPRRPRSAS